MRLDQYLTEHKLAPSRTKAQELIRSGAVTVKSSSGKKVITKPSHVLDLSEVMGVTVASTDELKYVSRGGLKLAGALEHVGFVCQSLRVLDVGLSTGGFAHCLLQQGAAKVIGIDVGHDQIHPSLKTEDRLVAFEGVHVRNMAEHPRLAEALEAGFDLVTVDVSFISLTQVVNYLLPYMRAHGHLLALVKPQFELGKTALNKKGVVKDEAMYEQLQDKIIEMCKTLGLQVHDYFASPILGKTGNREFFVYAQKI